MYFCLSSIFHLDRSCYAGGIVTRNGSAGPEQDHQLALDAGLARLPEQVTQSGQFSQARRSGVHLLGGVLHQSANNHQFGHLDSV